MSVLGLNPNAARLLDFAVTFFLAALFCAMGFILKMYYNDQNWSVNPDLALNLIFDGLWWNVKSVLFEELLFRGVLLYILLKRFGAQKSILISAICFGIYHWFSDW